MDRLWPRLDGQAASIGAEGVAVLAVVEWHGGLLSCPVSGPSRPWVDPLYLRPSVDGNLPEKIEVVQHFPRAQHHGGLVIVSDRASRISSSEITKVLGTPSMRSRPLTSNVSSSTRGKADPILILISSAVLSPTRRLYFRLRYWTMSSSILLPAIRTDRL